MGTLVGRYHYPSPFRKHSTELGEELRWPFYCLYLHMGVTPVAPGLCYVLVLWPPFNLHLKRLAISLRGFTSAINIITSCMVRLAIPRKVVYTQVFQTEPTLT